MKFLFAVIHLILTPEGIKLKLNFNTIRTYSLSEIAYTELSVNLHV